MNAISTLHSLFSLCIFMSFAQPPSSPFCLWLSLFTLNAGWGDHTCGVEKFARVQTAIGAEATQEADAAGHPGWQGRGAARRLQGDGCDTLAPHIKAFNISLPRPPDVCYVPRVVRRVCDRGDYVNVPLSLVSNEAPGCLSLNESWMFSGTKTNKPKKKDNPATGGCFGPQNSVVIQSEIFFLHIIGLLQFCS